MTSLSISEYLPDLPVPTDVGFIIKYADIPGSGIAHYEGVLSIEECRNRCWDNKGRIISN